MAANTQDRQSTSYPQVYSFDIAYTSFATTTVTNPGSTVTSIVPDTTIPAYLTMGGFKLRSTIYGSYSAATGTPTMTFGVYWGGTGGTQLVTVAAASAAGAQSGVPFKLEFLLVCTATSTTSATVFPQGWFWGKDNGALFHKPAPASAPASVGGLTTTSAQLLSFTVTFSSSSASNIIKTTAFMLESLGA